MAPSMRIAFRNFMFRVPHAPCDPQNTSRNCSLESLILAQDDQKDKTEAAERRDRTTRKMRQDEQTEETGQAERRDRTSRKTSQHKQKDET